jgi:hypothetical protein
MSKITAALTKLAERVNGDAGLVRRGRFVAEEFLLQIGDEGHYIHIDQGQVTAIAPGPLLMRPWRFAIHIQGDAWPLFCQPIPRPGYHDIFAMCKLGVARIEGDIQPLMANLRYFQELLAMARPKSNLENHEAAHAG